MKKKLVILETHPVQYHAPVYRKMAEMGADLEVVYGSDFSVRGYKDKEFGANFAWDKDLTAGTKCRFLEPEAESYEKVTGKGIGQALDEIRPKAALLCGYNHPFDRAAFQECRKRGIPILLRAETTDHAVRRGWLKSRIRDWRLRVIYRECAVLLPIGKRSREHYRRLGMPEGKMVDSPYCVDEASFLWDESARARLRAEQRTRMGIGDRGEGIEGGTKWILVSGKLVTIGSETFLLDEPFLVLATQNPIEQEGTYPLPEAQVDRFMLKVKIGYPSISEEKEIISRSLLDENPENTIRAVVQPEDILRARKSVKKIYMDEKIERYILELLS